MEKRIYNFEKIRGVDVTSSPINVVSNRASYMLNMINEGGTNKKRHGWQDIAWFEDREGKKLSINGIYSFGDGYVVHAGTHFYKCGKDFSNKELVLAEGVAVTNTKSRGYVQDGKLWIVGAGDYLVYDGDVIQPVMESMYAYIPTTSIGITASIEGDKTEAYQGVNLFTKKRKNKLIGYDNEGFESYKICTYRLDGLIDFQKPVRLSLDATIADVPEARESIITGEDVEISGSNGAAEHIRSLLAGIIEPVSYKSVRIELKNPLMVCSSKTGCSCRVSFTMANGALPNATLYFNGKLPVKVSEGYNMNDYRSEILTEIFIEDTADIKSIEIIGNKVHSGEACLKIDYTNNKEDFSLTVNGEDYSQRSELGLHSFGAYNQDGCGYIRFGHALSTPTIEGESNITVEYTADYESDIMISQSSEVTLSAGVNVLCLTNNSNMLYFSDFLYGYGYFPDNDYVGIGKENEPVSAILPLDDGSIGVFKKNEYYKLLLNVRVIDKEYVVRLEPSVVGYYPGIGCENQFVGANVNGDTLIFGASGVNGVISSASQPVNMRSTNVNRELCAYSESERESAFAVSHEGRYYLFIADRVYIADARYKTYESNRLDSGFEYEWWIWDGSDARCAYSLDGELLLGLEDGTVRQLGQGWCDERRINSSCAMGEMLYDGQRFTFSKELGVADGDRVQILNTYEKLNNSRLVLSVGADTVGCSYTEAVDFETNGSAILPFDSVILYNAENGIEIPCEVVELQPDSLGVVLVPRTKQAINQGLEWDLAREPLKYTAALHENGAVNLLDSDGRVAMFVANGEMAAVIEKSTPVACEIRTGAIDFYKLHSKTLLKLALTPSEDTVGEVEIGYETNLKRADKQRFVGDGFDFGSFDFKSFVFDGNFAKTFVKRVLERGFNYIIFRFASLGDGPFGIENAQAVYSVNNELRGDL